MNKAHKQQRSRTSQIINTFKHKGINAQMQTIEQYHQTVLLVNSATDLSSVHISSYLLMLWSSSLIASYLHVDENIRLFPSTHLSLPNPCCCTLIPSVIDYRDKVPKRTRVMNQTTEVTVTDLLLSCVIRFTFTPLI